MNTAVYLLRALQLGLRLPDLEELTVGMVIDLITESANDGYEYDIKATQDDFDKF